MIKLSDLLYKAILSPFKAVRVVRVYVANSFYRLFFLEMKGTIRNPRQLMGCRYIKIGKGSTIHDDAILTAWDKYGNQEFSPRITIGSNTNIGEHSHISACNSIEIGNGVLTGRYVYISDNSHGNLSDSRELDQNPIDRPLFSKGSVVIEDRVWIGERVCVCAGVKIGVGAVIAANAVVTHDIPAGVLAAGVPAKVIKIIKE